MLALGARIVELASAEALRHSPRHVTADERVMNTADAAVQALLGHYGPDGAKLGHAIYGMGAALGSLMAQCTVEAREQAMAALQHGLLRGSRETHAAFTPKGRA